MDAPLISVIVPVDKVEAYLDRCVQSIVNQTYSHLEIILVDDGSPDHCGVMCDAWAEKESRIQVIHKENGGVTSARLRGVAAATGSWIGFVDGDDYIEPDMYEHMYLAAEEHSVDVVFCRHTRDKEYVLNNSLRTEKKDSLIWINTLDERKKFMVSDIIGDNVSRKTKITAWKCDCFQRNRK